MYTYEMYMKNNNKLDLLDKGSSDTVELAKKTEQDQNGNNIIDTYAKRSLYGDSIVSVGRKNGTDIGECSCAIGYYVTASGDYSHAIGSGTEALGTFLCRRYEFNS